MQELEIRYFEFIFFKRMQRPEMQAKRCVFENVREVQSGLLLLEKAPKKGLETAQRAML